MGRFDTRAKGRNKRNTTMITIFICLIYLSLKDKEVSLSNLFRLFDNYPIVAFFAVFELLNEIKITFI